MRTSSSQFDLLITFMEQHGDLTKPSSNARGRISSLRHWEKLTALLNSDGSGDTKPTEKWKKVWSDFKNNTKKKAARLHRSATGTGGGPANLNKLTDLEQRVLNLIGLQVATGLPIEEAGFSQTISANHNIENAPPPINEIEIEDSTQTWHENIVPSMPSPEQTPGLSPPCRVVQRDIRQEDSQPWNEAGSSSRPHIPPPPSPEDVVVESITPTRVQSPSHIVRPDAFGQTPPRRGRPTRNHRSPRRLVRPAHTEQAAQHFLQAEEEWRKFKETQHRDYMDLRREHHRVRKMELEAQKEWQAIGMRALEILDKLVSKYCRD